ncbi:uncharacterized protein HGUI_02811 [Hanseniaspora guilliermondii]|uniref:Peroxisomal membrane protein PEX25 n=1 Tax=Hanseniaspora guilliermondii TaxID=56406 RepID=A0A1L0B6C2_9ASCO|nr:uncharacterized protein HGUI_02811 [Hanseniaspora guilliermondii]
MNHSGNNQSPFMSTNILFTPKKSNNHERDSDESSTSVLTDPNVANHKDALPIEIIEKFNRFQTILRIYNTVTGKDKIAKLLKFSFEILSILSKKFDISVLFTKGQNIYDLLECPSFSFDPFKAIYGPEKSRIIKVNNTQDNSLAHFFNSAAKQIGFFRHSLRFGLSYFNSVELYNQLKAKKSFKNIFLDLNEDDMVLMLEVYYNFVDDLLYLHKLNVWNNKSLKEKLDKQDATVWYYQIIYGLKVKYCSYCELNDKILELQIERNTLLKNENNLVEKIDHSILLNDLENLYKELELVKLDLYRLVCDFVADSIDVFDLKVPKGTYSIFSLMSAVFGFKKFYKNNELKGK